MPAGSWLSASNAAIFTAADHLSLKTISQIQLFLPSLSVLDSIVYALEHNDPYFEIDANTGFLRSKLEIDYETFKSYNLNLLACLTNLDQMLTFNKLCFKQASLLRIHILNKNDNEPKIIKKNNELSLNFFNTTELIRSMSLFKLRGEDADEQLNLLRFKILQVKSIPFMKSDVQLKKCNLNELSPSVDWFDLFQLTNDADQCIKLSDSGYESLIKLASKINHNHLNNCYFSLELTVSVSDGLFSSQKNFYLNLLFDDTSTNQTSTYSYLLFIKNGLVVPILSSIEFSENININSSENLTNLNDLVNKYLSSNHLNVSDQIGDSDLNGHLKFELRNYENYFLLNQTDQMLCVKKQDQFKFDRETRDTYELFIMVKIESEVMSPYRSLIPSQFRILIKLIDYNDNVPKFYLPSHVKHLKANLYELRRTLKWNDLISSNRTNPFLTVKANDLDIGLNSLIKYELVEDNTGVAASFLKVNERSGAIHLNSKLNSSFLWNKYSSADYEFHLEFSILACDQGQSERLRSILNVKLVLLLIIKLSVILLFLSLFSSVSSSFSYSSLVIELMFKTLF